jgi:hypothetical protein
VRLDLYWGGGQFAIAKRRPAHPATGRSRRTTGRCTTAPRTMRRSTGSS